MISKRRYYKLGNLYRNVESKAYINFRRAFGKSIPGIAITGCGRSGTTFTSELFSRLGYKVGHERFLLHGISSWMLSSNQKKVPWGPSRHDFSKLYLPIVHQVRNPISTISSMHSLSATSWEFIGCELPIHSSDSVLLKSMKYWYYWNLKSEEISEFTYQIEKIKERLPCILELGKFADPQGTFVYPNTNVNTRPHSRIDWDLLESENEELTDKIRKMAMKYGYSVK